MTSQTETKIVRTYSMISIPKNDTKEDTVLAEINSDTPSEDDTDQTEKDEDGAVLEDLNEYQRTK